MGGKTVVQTPNTSKQEDENSKLMMQMLAYQMADRESTQKEAEKSQDQSIYNSQVQAAQQAGTSGSNEARQQLALLSQYQQAKDAAAKELATQAAQQGAEAQTGVYDLFEAKRKQAENLGAVSGLLPQTQANIGMRDQNPAAANLVSALANKGVSGSNQNSTTQDKTKFGGY